MDCWNQLNIKATNNTFNIKVAYATKLKKIRPDDNSQTLIILKKAYEEAIELSKKISINGNDDTIINTFINTNKSLSCNINTIDSKNNVPKNLDLKQVNKYITLRENLRKNIYNKNIDYIVVELKSLCPNDAVVDYFLGLRNIFYNNYKLGYNHIKQAFTNCQNELSIMLSYGNLAITNDDIYDAVHAFTKCLSLDSDNPNCIKGIAMCYYHLKKYEESIILFEILLYIFKHDFTCRTYLHKSYEKIQEILSKKESLNIYEKRILVNSYKARNNYVEAFKLLKSMSNELTPEESLDLAIIATDKLNIAYDIQRSYLQNAIKSYKTVKLNSYIAYHKLGVTYYNEYSDDEIISKFKKIIKYFKKSIHLNPEFGDNYYYLGMIYRLTDKFKKSLNYLDVALEKCKNIETDIMCEKAICYVLTKNYTKCIDTINHMDNHDYGNEYFSYTKYLEGHCYYKLGDLENAKKYALQAKDDGYESKSLDKLIELVNIDHNYIEKYRQPSKLKTLIKNIIK